MIIDCHTHIYFEETYQEYLKESAGMVSVVVCIQSSRYDLEHLIEFASTKKDFFIIAAFDALKNPKRSLKQLERCFKEEKIVGAKVCPGCQKLPATDQTFSPLFTLCQKYKKPVIIHNGWSPDFAPLLKYFSLSDIDELARKYPGCNIIVSGFGFPYFFESAFVAHKNKNVFLDISGNISDGENMALDRQIRQYTDDLRKLLTYYPGIENKILFGTDFAGENTPLSLVNPYIKVIDNLFDGEMKENAFGGLAKKLFFNR
ncbi:hypothetical protein C4569_02515 [Candidatus Parcubacteria bacterium]|nr:MAG: hypothetical protein C4569_02515 [Candidatus Parcubacteria bacterium]